eukprot:4873917-Pyramimonas_sp.AAC.1
MGAAAWSQHELCNFAASPVGQAYPPGPLAPSGAPCAEDVPFAVGAALHVQVPLSVEAASQGLPLLNSSVGPVPFFPSSSLKIGSWNTHAFFAAVRSQSVKAPARYARYL